MLKLYALAAAAFSALIAAAASTTPACGGSRAVADNVRNAPATLFRPIAVADNADDGK